MADTPYIGSGLPAKIITTDGLTTLFDIARREMGDPLQWWVIAEANDLTDPWVPAGLTLKIPKAVSDANDGLPYA